MLHPIIGIWSGSAFPTQETSVVFFEDGNGLLFFYWGSQGSPTLSEFKWMPRDENSISLEWIMRHDYDYHTETNDEEEQDQKDEDDEEPDSEVRDHSKAAYTLANDTLVIQIGMHEFDHALNYAGKPGEFAPQKSLWEIFTREFNPFGPGRQVWIWSGKGWHNTGLTIEEKKPWWKFW